MTSLPPSVIAGTPPPGYQVPDCIVAPLVPSGLAPAWVGSVRPAVVVTSRSPLGCSSTFTSTSCESVATAASRWFSRSAVLCPPDFSDDDLVAELTDAGQRCIQRGHVGDDGVLRRLALRGVGVAERVDALRQAGRSRHDLALLRLVVGIVQQGRELVLQVAEQAGDVAALAGRALHRIDRLQRALSRLQSGHRGVLAEYLRLQRRVDRRGSPGRCVRRDLRHWR